MVAGSDRAAPVEVGREAASSVFAFLPVACVSMLPEPGSHRTSVTPAPL